MESEELEESVEIQGKQMDLLTNYNYMPHLENKITMYRKDLKC